MKRILLYSLLCFGTALNAQPWLSALRITFSNDGTNFSPATVFQDSSGVPTVAMLNNGTLISAFQWFPAPVNGPNFDSVAVKFSYDTSATWTYPAQVNFLNMPPNFKRPFDPTVVNAGGGQIRMYFSCGPTGTMQLDTSVNTYSAISTDGINFTFEQNARFDDDTLPVIDPAAVYFNGTWHYTAPRGAPQDGAFHATSSDGLNFTKLANITSDNFHQWTGNLMDDGTSMRFYGAGGSSIWWASSTDGNSWSAYNPTNIGGGDPAVIKLPDGKYMMIFVGPPPTSGIDEENLSVTIIFPNPFSTQTTLQTASPLHNATLTVDNCFGQTVKQMKNLNGQTIVFNRDNLASGLYFIRLTQDNKVIAADKLVIADK